MSASRDSATSNVRGYDRWSSFYDQYPNPTVAVDELHFPSQWQAVHARRVLEIGCGTGRHTVKLVTAGNHVTALDPSPGMLAVARDKLRGHPVQWVEADFMRCDDLPAAGYDVVVASLVLEHIGELVAFFDKLARVMAPGATFHLSELHPARAAAGRLAHFRAPGQVEEVWLDSHPHTSQAIRAAAQAAQFTEVAMLDIVGDDRLAKIAPAWARFHDQPMIQIWEFRGPAAARP